MLESLPRHERVSIFTVTYNQEAYIGPCIESVLRQTYSNWEMIIVDDGSTDRTWDVVQQYARADTRIKPHRRENKGIFALADAYNWMMDHSDGAIIAILDGDDLWREDKLAVQTRYHLEEKYEFTFGVCKTVSGNGESDLGMIPNASDRKAIAEFERSNRLGQEYLRGSFPISAVTCMVTRSSLENVQGFKQPSYLPTTDYPTWVYVLAHQPKAHFIEQELGTWRLQAGQTTWKRAKEMALGALRFSKEFVGTENDAMVMSANRRNFISDSLYRHAIYNLSQREYGEVWATFLDLARMQAGRQLFRLTSVALVRALRRVLHGPTARKEVV
ncbi:glycosyltransferase family 2 protein [Deinococcus yavapaiensis]|uniref:Glycosyl transferase family 2 n=1 Tax=Deinococcus yavapaiensis KR-236 TaxID=694435 RepID=A0A318SAQ3_9DEIO|nr:glycosyltransferase family 2 protein [Deinococcus yavapaiensis]PYE55642.1 glycosyl transferase family 2 [Deinococcus yavapaiensis KR-236]